MKFVAKNISAPVGSFPPVNAGSGVVNDIALQLRHIGQPLFLTSNEGETKLYAGALSSDAENQQGAKGFSGTVLPCRLENLGDPEFCHDHGIRYPYLGGSMAKGISSVEMAQEFGRAGMLGFFGAAGQSLEDVEVAIDSLRQSGIPFGFNLIHSPTEPELEKAIIELYLRHEIRLIEASAFLSLTLPIIRYCTHGIYRNAAGEVVTPNRIIAKISREEVAARFFSPPPEKYLRRLVESGDLSAAQAEMAAEIPVAQDVTVEADSGGHTDNRPALSLFPTIMAQKEQFQQKYGYRQKLRVGLGGGISTPASALAAFSMGAAYLVTGSVNQACIESGTCDEVRKMLAETRQADITMAPSGDMFEMGVKVQVVKRGTMFSIRAHKLYELYRAYDSMEQLSVAEREKLEKSFFRAPLATVWEQTRSYFSVRDPRQVEKAEADPKYKMALVFRWYLGQSPVWANQGEASRKIDYQIWCGPAMGAFNEWARGSFLEDVAQRKVVTVAYNILFGAAVLLRANQLKQQDS
ncbi:MAG: PfaD family polyunsaturated fatty acid/polyketide biosynthesis protein, partial [Thermodesulfobacteriota bacterium]|nr:PfaD family polyunsaturated fatty acid/polyketide biosynthesis protein [Thermodesulfobacteriota bacterium]